ncbi:MAG: hypothetical protein ABEH59_07725 [Halobacteriales archaeon]
MHGVVTRNAEELTWPAFDLGFYEVKDVTGRRTEPDSNGVNMISCFGDSRTVEESPELAARNAAGEPATRERRYFDWGTVCPSRKAYRSDLLDLVEECVGTAPDLRLDDVGFPRAEYCHCEVCRDAFAATGIDDWLEWRAEVVTDFVAEAADRVPGRTYLTLYPDPHPGHLIERSGVDVDSLAAHVDEFVVPLYDMAYSTTYWLEALASGFQDRLRAPLTIELYAVEVEIDALARAAEVADAYAERVLFAYDAETGRAVIDQLAGE